MLDCFDRVVCINLDRRPDRWEAFRSRLPVDWPFPAIERFSAIDGEQEDVPAWYAAQWRNELAGAWGCYQSHLRIWREAVRSGGEVLLVLEDDAVFAPEFSARVETFLDAVPEDWDQVYLGGQHLRFDETPPVRVNEHVIAGRNVGRTHAYAIRGQILEAVCERFSEPWEVRHPRDAHIDNQLGLMHQSGEWNIYAPTQWLVGQAAGVSDIHGRRFLSTMWWREFGIVEAVPC